MAEQTPAANFVLATIIHGSIGKIRKTNLLKGLKYMASCPPITNLMSHREDTYTILDLMAVIYRTVGFVHSRSTFDEYVENVFSVIVAKTKLTTGVTLSMTDILQVNV